MKLLKFYVHGVSGREVKAAALGLAVIMIVCLLMLSTEVTVSSSLFPAAPPFSGGGGGGGGGGGSGGGGGGECTPTTHIFFLKTHKCASSTVQNIFLRYGLKNNLTFALPPVGNYLGNPQPFNSMMVSQWLMPPGGKVDMFVVHTRLNPTQHTAILHNDTLWITIVRDPAALYESLYNFYHMNYAYGIQLDEFSDIPIMELAALPRYGGKLGKNQMLFDLGYSETLTVEDLRDAIDEIDRQFHLVMIAELMDQSLILLRHLLCWTLHDVTVFNKNVRLPDVKPKLDLHTQRTLRELNSADVLLYDHFLARHKEAVHNFGEERMAEEVNDLQRLRDVYYKRCGAREVKGRDKSLRFKEYSRMVNGYTINNNNTDLDCQMLSMPELHLIHSVRRRQNSLYGGFS